MTNKLLSLFAIATLTSFALYAEDEAASTVTAIQVNEENASLLSVNEILIEEEIEAEKKTEEETKLADCACGCGKCGKGRGSKYLLADCGCKAKKKGNAKKLASADVEGSSEKVSSPKRDAEKLAAADVEDSAQKASPRKRDAEKLASCCPGKCPVETTDPILNETVEEEKVA